MNETTTLRDDKLPVDTTLPPLDRRTVDAAIARAQAGVLGRQFADGAWRTCDNAGPPTTGWALVALRYLDALDAFQPAGAVKYMLAQQLPSGAFPDYPGDPTGSFTATLACYAGLYAAGVDPRREEMMRAWRSIVAGGGFDNADPITQAFLAAAGLYDPAMLDDVPLWPAMVPGMRSIFTRTLNTAFQLIMVALPGLLRGLRQRRQITPPLADPLGWAERARLIRYIKEVQDPTGNWQGTIFHTCLCAMTLYALGLPRSDAAIARALGRIYDWRYTLGTEKDPGAAKPLGRGENGDAGWQFAPYNSEAWNTAMCVSALVRSGVPADDARVRRATVFLLTCQGRLPEPPEWQNPPPGAPRWGGWAFEQSNSYNLDCDSTGAVLRALDVVRTAPSVPEAIDEGLGWLFGMQNDDGGWPSFTHGQAHKKPGPFPLGIFAPPTSLAGQLALAWTAPLMFGDPATEDLTGRVLQMLGGLGRRLDDPYVARAVAFVRSQLYDNGAWWGRWECNYLPSTAYILLGLAAVGEDVRAAYVRRAVAWICAHQNPDGGFGECTDSYGNLGLAGCGESTPYTSGLVVSALLAIGGHERVIERAVRYLLAQQRPDGLWSGGSYQLVVNAPIPFYKMPSDAWTAPLQALADYRARGGGVSGVAPQ